MLREKFLKIFGMNLKKNILKNFPTQKEFSEFFHENPKNVSKWCKGDALPDLFKIHQICESMGITVDYLIKGEPTNITQTSIDYEVFEEVVKLTNAFGKEINVEMGGKQYLAVYESITNLRRANNKLKTKEVFDMLRPTLESWKK